jgi:hypothetical protein
VRIFKHQLLAGNQLQYMPTPQVLGFSAVSNMSLLKSWLNVSSFILPKTQKRYQHHTAYQHIIPNC